MMQTQADEKVEFRRKSLFRVIEDELQITINAAAVKSGVPVNSLRKYKSGINRSLNLATYERLAAGLGTTVAHLQGEDAPPPADGLVEISENIIPIEVVGAVQAGEWAEAMEWDIDDRYDVYIPVDPRHKFRKRFGLEVRGQSMNRHYPEGTILLCLHLEDDSKLRSGQHVIVQRRRADDMIESTVKELVVTEEGKRELWPRSHDPMHQEPVHYDNGDAEEVTIIGFVVGMYRLI